MEHDGSPVGVLFEISIVCLVFVLFVCLVFCWVCSGRVLLGVSGVCLVVLFVWVVLVPGGLVFSGFVVLPG